MVMKVPEIVSNDSPQVHILTDVYELVGQANETMAVVVHCEVRSLLDTWSMVTCIADRFVKTHFVSLP
jgi:hypothetical protein